MQTEQPTQLNAVTEIFEKHKANLMDYYKLWILTAQDDTDMVKALYQGLGQIIEDIQDDRQYLKSLLDGGLDQCTH